MKRILCIALTLGSLSCPSKDFLIRADNVTMIELKEKETPVKSASSKEDDIESTLSESRYNIIKMVIGRDGAELKSLIIKNRRLEIFEFSLEGKRFKVTEDTISFDGETFQFCCIEEVHLAMKDLIEIHSDFEKRLKQLKEVWK